jgi:hypothetical protein
MTARFAASATIVGIAAFFGSGIVAAGVALTHLGSDSSSPTRSGPGISSPSQTSRDADTARIQRELAQAANELNATMPIMIDSMTRMDSMVVLGDRTLGYFYTLIGVSNADFDRGAFEAALRPTLVNNYATNPMMASLRADGVTLLYSYRFEGGAFAASIEIKTSDL